MASSITRRVRSLSPRSRRWRGFLASLPLDPDGLTRPLEQPGPRDFIICGVPRSGTTLVAAVLHRPPDITVAMEPWDGMRLPPAELFRSLRTEVENSGELARGKLDTEALERGDVRWRREGAAAPVATNRRSLLGVKWPAFWRYLDLLPETRFVVCVRHPAGVIASFTRVGGRLGEGLEYDTAFNHRMNEELRRASTDVAERRVLFHDYIASRVAPHLDRPNVFALRYERWFADPKGQLANLSAFLGVELGGWKVRIREPESDVQPDLRAFVRERCRESLGYDL